MDLGALIIFKTVAQEGSISKASEKLNYVQSNVTARIHQLEKELDTTLLYRHSRGISLTSSGETLLCYAEKILHLCDEAARAVQDTGIPSGTLKIGSVDETAAVRLPSILSTYHKQYPKVQINLATGPTVEHYKAVLNYEIEGAFVVGPVNREELNQLHVGEEELVLVTSPSIEKGSDIGEIINHTFLKLSLVCIYRERFEKWLEEKGYKMNQMMEFGSLEGILGCVKAGLGITLLPRSLVKNLEKDGEVVCHPIPDGDGKIQVVFIYRKDLHMSTAFKRFLEMISK